MQFWVALSCPVGLRLSGNCSPRLQWLSCFLRPSPTPCPPSLSLLQAHCTGHTSCMRALPRIESKWTPFCTSRGHHGMIQIIMAKTSNKSRTTYSQLVMNTRMHVTVYTEANVRLFSIISLTTSGGHRFMMKPHPSALMRRK